MRPRSAEPRVKAIRSVVRAGRLRVGPDGALFGRYGRGGGGGDGRVAQGILLVGGGLELGDGQGGAVHAHTAGGAVLDDQVGVAVQDVGEPARRARPGSGRRWAGAVVGRCCSRASDSRRPSRRRGGRPSCRGGRGPPGGVRSSWWRPCSVTRTPSRPEEGLGGQLGRRRGCVRPTTSGSSHSPGTIPRSRIRSSTARMPPPGPPAGEPPRRRQPGADAVPPAPGGVGVLRVTPLPALLTAPRPSWPS